ncbi:DNA-binding transcriptional regulator, LysR family [Tistlia consotensis]|uniref:Transcriptional regulator, LysR family n=1 Tax=Tistlia consotensis USBA 355 TaxID=560819 RepID=A0A1Y6C261_9PROT|nr:LysR family transcriptional regulator [Tistlia consotensis]SMF29643.1 transcriptional regulator, LysR family [Tistlia consotensis USBA 355]SNR91057.1 DNA-binding transcriptional regulator, LysR family [Tistlia consotensis]
MDLSSQMILFAKVVECASFSAAARELGHTPSAVSRQIGHLEDRLRVRLLNRTSQGLSPTGEGKAFYRSCADVAARVAEAERFASAVSAHPQGVLRVVATVAFGKAQLIPVLPAFLDRYPDLRVSLELTDRRIDLAEDEADVAVRFTEQLDQSSVFARKIARNRRVICAAPAYLARQGPPERQADLARHNCLRLSTVAKWNDWHLELPDGETLCLPSGNFEANSADAIYHAALAGIGVARLSTYLIGGDLESGRLVRLLPDYADESSDILALYADKRNLPAKVRLFIDYLVGCFSPVPPWEKEP